MRYGAGLEMQTGKAATPLRRDRTKVNIRELDVIVRRPSRDRKPRLARRRLRSFGGKLILRRHVDAHIYFVVAPA